MTGAVDLSGLAQRAQQGAKAGGPQAGGSSAAVEITEANFEAEVLVRSSQVPVVVLLWSPRSDACIQLADLLSGLAAADAGKWSLALVNVDAAPRVAAMFGVNPAAIKAKYNLPMLREVENYVAGLVNVDVPFNNYITGYTAFTHKAGIHAKAILNNPSTYEILDPADFGLTRYVHVAHRLTGWNAIKQRAEQLQLDLTDDQVKHITAQIKVLADQKNLSLEDVDVLLRDFHSQVVAEAALDILPTGHG